MRRLDHKPVGHSVLHGSMEYYVFSINAPLIEAAKRLRLSTQYATMSMFVEDILEHLFAQS